MARAGALLIAAYLVSLAALLGALVLLYRLTALELGRRAAGPAVLLLCVFPASLFLGAPYSESLFLLCSLGAFYAARTGRWAWAGAAPRGASATRSAGLLLLLPLVLIYLYGPRPDRPGEEHGVRPRGWLASLRPVHALRRDAAWLALAPLGLAAYAAWLGIAHGDPLAFSGAQDFWGREFAGPLVGVWDGAVAAFAGARQLLSGSTDTVYFERGGRRPDACCRDQPHALRLPVLRRGRRGRDTAPAAVRLRRLRGRGAHAAAQLPGRAAAADVAAAVPAGALPDLHVAGRGRRGTWRNHALRRRVRRRARAAHSAVRRLAVHLLMAVRAVLLDALGTLVELQPPGPRLRARLEELSGVDVGMEAAERGFAAEIGHYLVHHLEGGDQAGLERLRDDCAAVMHEALGAEQIDRAVVRRAMVESLEFVPYADAAPALRELRSLGVRLVVASNWDCSLPEFLDRAGLWQLVDGAVSSAAVGEAKPSPAVFRAALEIARVDAGEAVHVGDSLDNDIEGARAAGIRAVLVDRSGAPPPAEIETVRSLGEVASLV